MQTNRINGRNLIDILSGRRPELPLVGLDAGGSSNHKLEAAVVWLGYYSGLGDNPKRAKEGADRLLQLMENQLTQGHMLLEPNTDSHEPIWLRAMAGARIISHRLRDHGFAFGRLHDLVLDWFEVHRSILLAGQVPRGPLADTIILPCSRKSPGVPGNAIRDAWLLLAEAGKAGKVKGVSPRAYRLDKEREDNAGLALTLQILAGAPGQPPIGFGPNFKRGTMPRFSGPFVIERRPGGHLAHFPEGIPGGADVALRCWVEYESGRYSFDGSEAPALGGPGVVRSLPAAR